MALQTTKKTPVKTAPKAVEKESPLVEKAALNRDHLVQLVVAVIQADKQIVLNAPAAVNRAMALLDEINAR